MHVGYMSKQALHELCKIGVLSEYSFSKMKFCNHHVSGNHMRVSFMPLLINVKVFLIVSVDNHTNFLLLVVIIC